ncbi:unnamed protein product [Cylicocyclus nassatus]|uniref:Endonuclease/exonuclease/phosphatase domain-containing protein n=1 Tax=Cylicocyclus nassatus TaxID=53992 RepID=A0AA36DPY3_CYLNA|nr:unnamed protein product [Cylicocyclus nassatus]
MTFDEHNDYGLSTLPLGKDVVPARITPENVIGMLRTLLAFYLLFCSTVYSRNGVLRVMTFNIWLSGASVHNGLQKIAKHIALVNPDIVALQEVENVHVIGNLTQMLGGTWTGINHRNTTLPDTAILTRHEIHPHSYADVSKGVGVKILVDQWYFVNFWSLHLDYLAFGPYAAYNKMVTSVDQIMAGEHPRARHGREQNMEELRNSSRMTSMRRKSAAVPVIVAGDFNCPSHLDWAESAKDRHGGWAVQWPATKIMAEMNFTDSFREVHPDIDAQPGNTWSTVNKFNAEWDYAIPEPQDRIDFIFYLGKIKPINSFIYAGTEQLKPIPYHKDNDYPSDHFAVVTEFSVDELRK